MAIHIAWICGWLVVFGVASPYARADDMQRLASSVATLQKNVNIGTRISLGREIRDQMAVRCHTTDESALQGLSNYIESLQSEYLDLTGQRYPETICR